jgi:hypothetical protein
MINNHHFPMLPMNVLRKGDSEIVNNKKPPPQQKKANRISQPY